MKTFNETIQDIESVQKKLNTLDKKEHKLIKLLKTHSITLKDCREKSSKICKKQNMLHIEKELLELNASYLIAKENISVFFKIWNTYNSKKLDNKIEEKIQNEFKEKSGGLSAHFERDYTNKVREIVIEYNTNVKNFFNLEDSHYFTDKENQILFIKEDDIIVLRNKYIENIFQQVKLIKKDAKEIEKNAKKLKALYHKFKDDCYNKNFRHFFNLYSVYLD